MAGRCGCAKTCSCCSASTATVQVSGSGSAGQCFAPSVVLSAAPGNRLHAEDDGLHAGLCALAPDGSAVSTDGNGCLELPPPVIRDQGGDPIAPGEDGSVTLPANTPPAFGCGLAELEDGTLVAATGTWPPAALDGDPVDGDPTDGAAVVCEPISGELRGAPEHTSVSDDSATVLVSAALIDTSPNWTSAAGDAASITNPSPARRMTVQRTLRATVELVTEAGQLATVHLQERVNGGAWNDVRLGKWPEPTAGGIRASLQIGATIHANIAAADTMTVEARVFIESAGATLVGVSVAVGLLGVTR